MKPETLTLQGRLHEIERASSFATRFCQARGLGADCERVLMLILEELVTNTVKHGAAPADAPILVELDMIPEGIALSYRDHGKPFDPRRDLVEPDLEKTLSGRAAGGLGWPLIKYYCKSLDYARDADTNLTRLVVRLVGDDTPPPA